MDERLFSLCKPAPPGFVHRDVFQQRDFRSRPFALLADDLEQAEAFLGEHLPKLCGLLVTVGPPAWSWEERQEQVFWLRVPAECLSELGTQLRPYLSLLDKLQDRSDTRTLLQLELNRVTESRNRMAGEFDGIRGGLLREIEVRRAAQQRLEESEQRLQGIYDASPDGILVAEVESRRLISANARMCEMLGVESRCLSGMTFADIHPPDSLEELGVEFERLADGGSGGLADVPLRRPDGSVLYADLNTRRLTLGGIALLVGIFRDATERRRLEQERVQLQDRLLQSQKMESVGRLAGGVAHDFNNMLGVIVGYTDLLLHDLPAGAPAQRELQEIHNAAQRSADLTRQLLAFARKQPIQPRVLDLAETVGGLLGILQRLIGEQIELDWRVDESLWPLRMDSSQVDQLLTNLCVNARDAISGHGRIQLEARNVRLGPSEIAGWAEAQPGDYLRLSVRDSGKGMPPEVLEHLFEPFFTTKGLGQGTGLGMATVYGIVSQNRGFIQVESEPGRGTCVAIHLPRHVGEADPARELPAPASGKGGSERVLLVEDEPRLLDLCQRLLGGMGYQVLAASTPAQALELARMEEGRLALLVTDVIMPGMNGRELAQNLRLQHPRLRCLFMSGYTADILAADGESDVARQFLQKPFSLNQLAVAVRQALGESVEELDPAG